MQETLSNEVKLCSCVEHVPFMAYRWAWFPSPVRCLQLEKTHRKEHRPLLCVCVCVCESESQLPADLHQCVPGGSARSLFTHTSSPTRPIDLGKCPPSICLPDECLCVCVCVCVSVSPPGQDDCYKRCPNKQLMSMCSDDEFMVPFNVINWKLESLHYLGLVGWLHCIEMSEFLSNVALGMCSF